MNFEDSINILYRASRDEAVAVCVLFAGIGLLIAFLILLFCFVAVEPIALIVGSPTTIVGLVSLCIAKRNKGEVEKATGMTWRDIRSQIEAADTEARAEKLGVDIDRVMGLSDGAKRVVDIMTERDVERFKLLCSLSVDYEDPKLNTPHPLPTIVKDESGVSYGEGLFSYWDVRYLDRHDLVDRDASFRFFGASPIMSICGQAYRVEMQSAGVFCMGKCEFTDEGKELSALFERANHPRLLEFARKRAEEQGAKLVKALD